VTKWQRKKNHRNGGIFFPWLKRFKRAMGTRLNNIKKRRVEVAFIESFYGKYLASRLNIPSG